jgi:Zn-dependent peptidase ImmA (M78 family)
VLLLIAIKKTLKKLVNECNTRNVYDICSFLDIEILKHNLNNMKGYFLNIKGKKAIILNTLLPEVEEVTVIAHELGHITLHSSSNICFLTNYTYSNTNKLENEANEFAAELLITDQDIKDAMEKQFSIEQMACYFEVPKELIEYKFK